MIDALGRVEQHNRPEIGLLQLNRGAGQGCQNRIKINHGGELEADVVERGQFTDTLLGRLPQPRIFDGDGYLIGDCFTGRHIARGERFLACLGIQPDRANDLAIHDQRHNQHITNIFGPPNMMDRREAGIMDGVRDQQ